MVKIPTWFIVVCFILSIIGFTDATYLTFEHLSQGSVSCPIVGDACNKVLTSKYSEMFGIPTALFGSVYYFVVFVLLMLLAKKKEVKYLILLVGVATCGFLFSLYMVYLQLFVIHAICPYCMGSAGSSTVLFVLSSGLVFWIMRKSKILAPVSEGEQGDNFV